MKIKTTSPKKMLECEHCGHIQEAEPHRFGHYWNRVHLPAIKCNKCGKAQA